MSSLYRKFEIGLVSYLGKQSLHTSQVAYQANASLGFLSMKQLAVFLFPARWDASLLQGTSRIKFACTHLYT